MHATPTPCSPRKWRAKILLAAGSLLGGALAIELGLRAVGFHPPEILTAQDRRQYRNEPGSSFTYRGYLDGMFSDFANPVTLNKFGFHDVDHEEARSPTNTYRVMVVGDSYVAALSCPLETTFFRRLERKLNAEQPFGPRRYEVIACGQGNQAQTKETLYVEKLGPVFRPDAVILIFFCGNDFMENCPETFRSAARFAEFYKKTVAPRKLACYQRWYRWRWSRLNGLVAAAVTTWYANHLHLFHDDVREEDLVSPELGVYRVPLAPEWQRAYDQTAAALAHFQSSVEALGVPLFIAGLSGPQAIGDVGHRRMTRGGGSDIDPLQPARWLEAWCKTNGVPYVPLEPALARAGRSRVFWRHDGHLNPYGNEVITEPLYNLVTESKERP